MGTTVGNVPAGLLSLLRAQNFGENPRDLSGTISSVVDVRDQYIFNNLEHGFALFTPTLGFVAQNTPTLSGEISVTVPTGELWWIEDVSIRLNPQAGISFRGQIVLREPPTQHLALSETFEAQTGEHVVLGARPRFWIEPGCTLMTNFDKVVGVPAAGACLMTLRYARFRM